MFTNKGVSIEWPMRRMRRRGDRLKKNTLLDTKGQSKATSTGGYAAEYRLHITPDAEECRMHICASSNAVLSVALFQLL